MRSVPAQCGDPTRTTSPSPLRDQLDAAQDERPHEDLAELGVGLHERQETRAIELDDLAGLDRARPDQRAAAREHVDFAGELAGAVDRDDRVGRGGGPDDLDLTLVITKNGTIVWPASKRMSPGRDRPDAPVLRDARDVRRREHRKHLLGPARSNRGRRWRCRSWEIRSSRRAEAIEQCRPIR